MFGFGFPSQKRLWARICYALLYSVLCSASQCLQYKRCVNARLEGMNVASFSSDLVDVNV